MKTFNRTCFYVYWFLPILILSGEVLSAKGKVKLVKKLRHNPYSISPLSLHSHHVSPQDCRGPNCKTPGELEDKSRLKRNHPSFPGGSPPQWHQPHPQQNFPQFNQPHHQFPVPQDHLMPNPHQMDNSGHFEPSAAPQQMQQQQMPMARSDNTGQGMITGPPSTGPSSFTNPTNFQQGPTGLPNEFQGPGGIPQNPILPFNSQPDSPGVQQPPNLQNNNNVLPPNQHQARFGEPMELQTGSFQENNFNFQQNNNDPTGQHFQGPPQQFNNNNGNNNQFPQNPFQDNNNNGQFPLNNNPHDQFGASSFQQQSFNGNNNGDNIGFPQGDPNNPPGQNNPFPFPPPEMNNNNNNNFPFPNQPPMMNPNMNNFNSPPNFPDNLNRELPQGGQGPFGLPGQLGNPFPNNQNPAIAPVFPNHLGNQPTNTSFYPRTTFAEDSGDTNSNNDYTSSNDGYDESETSVSNYHDDDYYDGDYKKKHSHGLFKKHKGKLNEDHVVSIIVQVAWKIISSYIFVFVANMLIGFLGKATGLSDSYVETHITLGNDGKHPFGNYADSKDGHASSYGSPGHGSAAGSGGSKKGTYALSNGLYHPASALYQHPTYQYHKGGKEHTLLGYDQYHAVKYAKKYSKKYAKKAGKYGLRPKPIGPYLPAYQYGLPPGPLALGWTAGSGGPNGFYKRTGTSQEPMKAIDDDKKRNDKDKAAGRNGDGIKSSSSTSSTTTTNANSTELIEESEEDEEESDEDEESSTSPTLLSVGNETLTIVTIPTVETNSTSSGNERSEELVDSSEDDEVTTTLLPVISDEENDLVKTSTDASAANAAIPNSTTTTSSSGDITSSTVATRIETADGLYTFKTGTRGNSRIFSSLKSK